MESNDIRKRPVDSSAVPATEPDRPAYARGLRTMRRDDAAPDFARGERTVPRDREVESDFAHGERTRPATPRSSRTSRVESAPRQSPDR